MKRTGLIIAVLGISMGMLLCGGCEDDAKVSDGPKVEDKPKTTVIDTAKPTNTDTAKPVRPKPTPPKPVDPNTAPKVVLETTAADFGEVGGGVRKTVEVKITNKGKSTLKITRVDGCCGCSGTLDTPTAEPGKSIILKATCSFSSRPGSWRRTMYFHCNDPLKPKVGVPLKAKIVQKISFEPTALKLFLDRENSGCPPITIKSLDGKPFAIQSFKATADAITAVIDPNVEATEFALEPKVDSTKLKAGLNGFVEIGLTHPDTKTASISFSALPKYKLSPPQVILFNAEAKKPVVRKIWVLNNYEEQFEIASTKSGSGNIELVAQRAIRNGFEFEVKITPPAQLANKTVFTDTFSVVIKDGETLSVPCRGFYLRKTK